MKRLAAAGAVAALAAYAGLYEPRRLVVRRADLALPHWPQALAGLRVGVMSDLHAGSPHASADIIGTWVERMNAEAPDLVALPGDFLDAHFLFGGRLAPERIGERLAALRAPLGAVAVLGNHDWKLAGARMWLALERAGIVVLENASHAIEARGTRFHVAGLGDFRLRHPDVVTALAGVPDGEPVLLLSHDPDMFPRVPARVSLDDRRAHPRRPGRGALRPPPVHPVALRRAVRARPDRRARPPPRRELGARHERRPGAAAGAAGDPRADAERALVRTLPLRNGVEPREVRIRGDMIRLGELLKLAGVVGTGGEAKALLASAPVAVNGEPESRRGRQLRPGDEVRVGDEVLRVAG